MSYFAPHLTPGRHMIDALISSDEFYAALLNLKKGTAQHLLYVTEHDSILIAPLYHLADVDEARLKAENPKSPEKPDPGHVDYLRGLTKEWVSIIARAAIEHPLREKVLAGIHTALNGDLPARPIWTRHFDRAIITGDDDTVHLKPRSTLTSKTEDGGTWELSSEPAADLIQVLKALGYGHPPRINPGRKSI